MVAISGSGLYVDAGSDAKVGASVPLAGECGHGTKEGDGHRLKATGLERRASVNCPRTFDGLMAVLGDWNRALCALDTHGTHLVLYDAVLAEPYQDYGT